jgi:hypothetical protein
LENSSTRKLPKDFMSDKACHNMDSLPVTNKTLGEPESLMNKTLETGASAVQVKLLFVSYSLR